MYFVEEIYTGPEVFTSLKKLFVSMGVTDVFDVTSIYKLIDKDENPKNYTINKGPFNLFAIIDGHGKYGDAISYVIKKHLLDVVYRNKNIMVSRRYSKGLKEVFVKLD